VDDQCVRELSELGGFLRKFFGIAHDQLVVLEEGQGGGHPEADALVHVQLTCGLVRQVSKFPNGAF
jgi:hypothetical protein